MTFLYLHGFASSPDSAKAVVFRDRLRALGVELLVPSMEEGDFEGLTITRQLALVERTLAGRPGPHVLIGSSMGGFVASLYASKHDVAALVLMAPAVDFERRLRVRYGDVALAMWQRDGHTETFHHGRKANARIGFGLVRDARFHPPLPIVNAPMLILQGKNDEVVSPATVTAWAGAQRDATLVLLDSGHELTDAIDPIWDASLGFLRDRLGILNGVPEMR